MPCVPRRPYQPRHVAQKALREISEAQFLEILHVAPHHAFMHGFVEWDERLLEKAAETLSNQQLRQVVLQLPDAMLPQEFHRRLDFAGQGHRVFDGNAHHRL